MRWDDAKHYMQTHADEYLERDKSGRGYICPICGSGSGAHGTGITVKDDHIHYTCWTGCFSNSDILDIIGKKYGLTEYKDKMEKAAELFHITLDGRGTGSTDQGKQNRVKIVQAKGETKTDGDEDYTELFKKWSQQLDQTSYLKARGISTATAKRFWIGYEPHYKHTKSSTPWAAVIFPTSKSTFEVRNTDTAAAHGNRYRKTGHAHLFNVKALEAEQPVIVTEGIIDALSIIEVGGNAIGLGSADNSRILFEEVKKRKGTIPPLVLSFDNDAAGQRAAAEFAGQLNGEGIECYIYNLYGTCKDANEALVNYREALAAAVQQASSAEQLRSKELEEQQNAYKEKSVVGRLQGFLDRIAASTQARSYSTGLPSLDELLDGGLYTGFYVVGAISSLGKTTFCLQMMDSIAAHGDDVMIFSLEMAADELIAKSISRHTLFESLETYRDTKYARTVRGITTGKNYAKYSDKQKEIIEAATNDYANYADHIYIKEGMGNIGVKQIYAAVDEHIKMTGKAPVVLVDYIQILAPYDENNRMTDKQVVDKNVLELKRLSRDKEIPVVAISSFNRASYTDPVSMSSFKESGAVEYSSDVLLALQYNGMDYQEGEGQDERRKRIRELIKEQMANAREGQAQAIQIKVLKNRNGSRGDTVVDYYPMFNYFCERGKSGVTSSKDDDGDEWTEV